MIFKQYTLNGKRHVSNGKRHVINVNKRVKMFALSAWMQIAVVQNYLAGKEEQPKSIIVKNRHSRFTKPAIPRNVEDRLYLSLHWKMCH